MRIGPFDTDRIARDVGRAVNDVATNLNAAARDAERGANDAARGAQRLFRDAERGVRGGLDAVGRSVEDFGSAAVRAGAGVVREAERSTAEALGLGARLGGVIAVLSRGVAGAVSAVVSWVADGVVDLVLRQPADLAGLRARALAANQGPPARRLHGSEQDVRDFWSLTEVTYDAERGMPDGWTEVPNASARLSVPLSDPASGLDAKVFEKDGVFVLVFEGTTVTSLDDWETNIPQGFGSVPPQYRQALDIALRFREEFSGEGDLVVTGHSLGGGLATFAGVGAGIETYTFNPSGLGPGSREFLDSMGLVERNEHLVKNFVQHGDVLDLVRHAQYFAMPGYSLLSGGSLQLIGEVDRLGSWILNPIEAHLDPELD